MHIFHDRQRFESLTFCLVTEGSPYCFCFDSVLCKDANSVCSIGICQCNSGFRNTDGECREGNGLYAKIKLLLPDYMMLTAIYIDTFGSILNDQLVFRYRWFA